MKHCPPQGYNSAMKQAGKSTILKYAGNKRNVMSHIRPHLGQWPVVFEICEKLGVTVRGNTNSGDLSFPETRNRILVRGLDNDSQLNKLRGNKFPGAVIDEAQHLGGDLSGFIDDVLEPALLDLGGEILLCGTPGELPVGPFYDITEGGRPGWEVFRWTLRDNPYLLVGNAQFSDPDELLADIRRSKGWTDRSRGTKARSTQMRHGPRSKRAGPVVEPRRPPVTLGDRL